MIKKVFSEFTTTKGEQIKAALVWTACGDQFALLTAPGADTPCFSAKFCADRAELDYRFARATGATLTAEQEVMREREEEESRRYRERFEEDIRRQRIIWGD